MNFRISLLLLFVFSFMSLNAQENIEFQVPPKEILELADYERAPIVIMDSDKNYMVMIYRDTYKTLDDLNQEEMRLGGLRINPNHNISSRVTYYNNLKVQKTTENEATQVSGLPAQPRIANISWSPDETKVSFTHTGNNGLELWVLDVKSASAKRISSKPLNANLGNPITWSADSKEMLINCVPDGVKLIDPAKELPKGPIVSESDGTVSQNRTYQDLLKNKTDEYNFEQLVSSEIYQVDLNGNISLFKPKDMYDGVSYSPDGNYILISTIKKPFSYLIPYHRFPLDETVYDKNGKLVKQVNFLEMAEDMPKGFMSVRKGKRTLYWRPDMPSSLVYVEALDEGDAANEVEYRDAIYTWDAPFNQPSKLLLKTEQRYSGIQWGDSNYAVVNDYWYDTRNTRSFLFNPSKAKPEMKLLVDRNYQDIYSDPGSFETRKNRFGKNVIAIDNDIAYLIGDGYTENGQFPFIDKLNLKTLKKDRWYQSVYTDKKEMINTLVDSKKGIALVRIESPNEYPNYYFRNLNKKEDITAITQFKNPFESIKDVHKEVIKYQRKDGVELSGTLYLPKGYDINKKEKMPLLIWAYPTEFKDKSSAGQSSQNPNAFTFPYYGSFVYWVTRGYVVLDDAAFPIVGEGDTEPNDTFVEQLVMNAEAAIDAVDKLGYIDRNKVAVGGHSYGAFMTANLLSHSDLFACGIARSGAYNRTLTPFGFQREQRNYWEAKDLYNTMSPFMNVEKVSKPMLLIHGEADNNPGTFTLQTERYYQALKGLGAPVRMVILPMESHGYVAKDNILHLLWEQDQFLEKCLK